MTHSDSWVETVPANTIMVGNNNTYLISGPRQEMYKLTGDFVSSSREAGPSQRREPGHAPGVGPNPSGAQQSLEMSSELCEGHPKG